MKYTFLNEKKIIINKQMKIIEIYNVYKNRFFYIIRFYNIARVLNDF
jgi:hypothetical protein